MATVQDLFTQMFYDLGVLAQGQSIDSVDADSALYTLNGMLDAWNAEGLLTPYQQTENFTLVPGQVSYTIGSGGNFDTTRPVDILYATIRDTIGNDFPMKIIGWQDYQAIRVKGMVQTNYPDRLTYQKAVPLGTITIWPVPTQAYSIYLTSWKQLGSYALSDTLALEPGYQEAIYWNLGARMAYKYGKSVDAGYIERGSAALRSLRRQALDRSEVPLDSGVMQFRKGGFNINRGWS